jgi:phosphoribosylformimino-5-aminoimidazole carboxamide ribotide isomerase
MRIIPAIDIIDGKCIRLTQGDYAQQTVYNENPLEVAKQFEDAGIRYLHLVDLDGAKSSHIVNYKVLERIVAQTRLQVDFGGGIKSDEDIRIAFESGAAQVTGGSIAVSHVDLFTAWIEKYGTDKIILGADCRNRKIVTRGWLDASEQDVLDFIRFYQQRGITQTICTDVLKDGTLEGPPLALYEELLRETGVQLIASGGIASMDDVRAVKALGCSGVIIGKAIYEKKIGLKALMTVES